MAATLQTVALLDKGKIVGSGGGSGSGPSSTVLTETLTAGSTTLTFTDPVIVSTSMCDLYVVGDNMIAPSAISDDSANHSVSFTFDEQSEDITFQLLVLNFQ